MNELVVKDVEFNGANLKAAKDADGVIWAGVRYLCKGIGLSDGQTNNQLRKIGADEVLNKGCANLVFPSYGGDQTTKCMQLNYIPLWLAKINVTPAMKRENPEVAANLLDYQLRAKDILSEAFVEKKLSNQTQTIQIQMPDYEDRLEQINRKIDQLYIMFRSQSAIEQKTESKPEIAMVSNPEDERHKWKMAMNELATECVGSEFKDRNAVYQYIFCYMRKNYGIVWEQESKEYKERTGENIRPFTINVVYSKEMLKSIFESILRDMVQKKHISNFDQKSFIRPLAQKMNDNTVHMIRACRKVYAHMSSCYGIDWDRIYVLCSKKYGIKGRISKMDLIKLMPDLQKVFKQSIVDILNQGKD